MAEIVADKGMKAGQLAADLVLPILYLVISSGRSLWFLQLRGRCRVLTWSTGFPCRLCSLDNGDVQ
jgi:hypothetical protein